MPNPDPTSPFVGLRHGQTLTRDWWECRDCRIRFVPQVAAALRDSERLDWLATGAHLNDIEKEYPRDDGLDFALMPQLNQQSAERFATLRSAIDRAMSPPDPSPPPDTTK